MRSSSWRLLTTLTTLLQPCMADWQFRSRPDLSPPRLNITVPADHSRVSEGYIFITPYDGFGEGAAGPQQPGAYIYHDNGELVWSGFGYSSGWFINFRPDIWKGEQVLRGFQGLLDKVHGRMYGYHVIFNNKYEIVKTSLAGGHRLVSAHEFNIVDGKTVLIEIPISKPIGLKKWGGGEGQDWIVSGGFQELNIETGEVVFEWESIDHVDPKYSALPLGEIGAGDGYNTSDAWNYFHINSIDKNADGDYLISARNYAAVFKINGTTGEVIWQLGGLHGGSSFDVHPDAKFAFQHDTRYLWRSKDGSIETISLFDNAAHSAGLQISPSSRARIIQLNHTAGTAVPVRTFPAPDGLSAWSQGNAQVLSNGNVFVNWGQAGAITEFADDGTVLFHSYLDSSPEGHLVQSYRGFRFNWTGIPIEEPALLAVRENDSVNVYVSWNGDTETAQWSFYATKERDKSTAGGDTRTLLGKAARTGFETHLELSTAHVDTDHDTLVFAEATDLQGKVLSRTAKVSVLQDIPSPPSKKGGSESEFAEFGEL